MEEPTGLRGTNMRMRRARILAAARGLLASGGFQALNLRDLARAAAVTVPTIYNLVGNKEEVLCALFREVLDEIEARIGGARDLEPLAAATAVVTESTGLFAEDEDFYRTAFLAVESLDEAGTAGARVALLYAWGERLITAGFEACRAARLLRGRIPTGTLGELVLRSFRTNCRAWALGRVDIDEFRRLALTDLYVSLAADAVESFQGALNKRIAALVAGGRTQARHGPARQETPR
jgi:AcrR family transcriptional regulator